MLKYSTVVNLEFKPDAKLKQKYCLYVLSIFLIIEPWIFFSILINNFGLVLLIISIYTLANLIWVLIAIISIGKYIKSLKYEISNEQQSVIAKAGIITKSVKNVPFKAITNISIHRGPFDRICKIASIHIETAGYHSAQSWGPEIKFSGIRKYKETYEQIIKQIKKTRVSPIFPTEELEETSVGSINDLLKTIVEELREIKKVLQK